MIKIQHNETGCAIQFGGGSMGTLCLIFIVLKLVGVISWSWWWVLAPVLWPFYLIWWLIVAAIWVILGLCVLVLIVYIIARLLGGKTY